MFRKESGISDGARQLLVGVAGAVVGFGLAAFLHFIYDWTGGMRLFALFAAVNESVWEHVKILLWPYLLIGVAEYYILKPDSRRFIMARTLGAWSIAALTICVFFIYSGIVGRSVVWVDIASAGLWLAAGELICLRALNSPKLKRESFFICMAALVLLVVMLLCFSVSPPRIGLFRDPIDGLYGLEKMP